MLYSGMYTKKLNTMFTLGRVQTPTLAMVVNRHKEIINFIPKDYWEVEAVFDDFSAMWFNPEADDNQAVNFFAEIRNPNSIRIDSPFSTIYEQAEQA